MQSAQPETAPWAGASASDVDFPGTIGKYTLQHVLGTGGEGIVFAAHDRELGRSVAIKFRTRDSEESRQRLIREAQAMAQLDHPNVVTVHEVLRLDERIGIVMALVAGSDLQRWLESPRTWREIASAYLQAAQGLAAAHRAGIVHRDFKPSNAIIDAHGVVRVSDFGLARAVNDATAGASELADGSELTQTGAVLGTPAYTAPEQRRGHRVDARADQYSFAVALYEALVGERPDPERSRTVPAPRWLRRVVVRALSVDPAARFPSMTDVVRALEVGLAQRRRWVIAGVVGAVLLGATLVVVALLESMAPKTAAPTSAETPWTPVAIGSEPGESPIRTIAISRDGSTLAYAYDTEVIVEPRSGGPRVHVAVPAAIGATNSLHLSRTGDRVLVGVMRSDRAYEIWESAVVGGTWERRRIPAKTASYTWDVDPDGTLLVEDDGDLLAGGSGGRARLIRVDRAGTERVLAVANPGENYRVLRFSFDGQRVAIRTNMHAKAIIDIATRQSTVVTAENIFCTWLDWIGPDRLVCAGGDDQRIVELFPSGAEWSTGKTRYVVPSYGAIVELRTTDAGVLIVEQSMEMRMHMFDLERGTRQILATGSVIDLAAAGWMSSGSFVFGANLRGRLQMLAHRPDGTIEGLLPTPNDEVPLAVLGEVVLFGRFPNSAAMIPRTDIVEGRYYGDGELFRLDADKRVTPLGPTHHLLAVRCAGDRAPPCILLESTGEGGAFTATLWDPVTGTRGRELLRGEGEFFHALAPDGRTVAYVTKHWGSHIALVDLDNKKAHGFDVPGYALRFLTWQSDGGLVATVVDVETGHMFVSSVGPNRNVPIATTTPNEFIAEPRISRDGKRLGMAIADPHRRLLWVPLAPTSPSP